LGDTPCFAPYDAGGNTTEKAWPVPEIFDSIEKDFAGSRVVMLADCCFSGSLIEEAKKRHGIISYACLSSVTCDESSTAYWTYSDSLLDALNGRPQLDANADGVITF